MHRRRIILGLLLIPAIAGCDSVVDSDPPPPHSVVLPAVVTLMADGDTAMVEAEVLSRGGARLDARLDWASSAPSVATVDGDGIVTGQAPGMTTLTAAVDGIVAEAEVRVVAWEEAPTPAPLSVGGFHSCAIGEDGGTYCWGANGDGQLGTGDTVSRATPTRIDPDPGFVLVSAGDRHTCGLTADGVAWCWGRNEYGQLGVGGKTARPAPSPVSGGTRFTRLDAGVARTCALAQLGRMWCWGRAESGAVPAPTRLPAVRYNHITVGWGRTCGIVPGGEAYCWGAGSVERQGSWAVEPERVDGDELYRWISVGISTCGSTMSRQVRCWGHLKLGEEQPSPVRVMADGEFDRVETVEHHTCGVRTDGVLVCWGSNWEGQLGRGYRAITPEFREAEPVSGGGEWRAVGVGHSFTCGVSTEGVVACWGLRDDGRLGDGSFGVRADSVARPVAGELRFSAISAGSGFTCGVTVSEHLACWGDASDPDEGSETKVRVRPVPVVLDAPPLGSVSAGSEGACGVGLDSQGYCWEPAGAEILTLNGSAGLTELDVRRSTFTTPDHVCGIDGSERVRCWDSPSSSPNGLDLGAAVVAITFGMGHTCALGGDGAAYCWGLDRDGQLGRGGPAEDYAPPTRVGTDQEWSAISAGLRHTCGIDDAGLGWCWGWGTIGQIGDGVEPTGYHGSFVPVRIDLDASLVSLDAGPLSTCAVTNLGTAHCWGRSGLQTRYSPTSVEADQPFSAVTTGHSHACALDEAGKVHCWGSNEYGELGRGPETVPTAPAPVPVVGSLRVHP